MSFPDGLARPRNGGKMSHLVAGELRRQIVRGQIAPGDTLPSEAELIKVLDVSRDTLREALRMLESESLIYIRRGRHGGAVVRRADLRAVARYVALLLQIRQATLDDVHEARLVLGNRRWRCCLIIFPLECSLGSLLCTSSNRDSSGTRCRR